MGLRTYFYSLIPAGNITNAIRRRSAANPNTIAAELLGNIAALRRFICSGKADVPQVIEKLPPEIVAGALCQLSQRVLQLSVKRLVLKEQTESREGTTHYRQTTFEMEYAGEPVITGYLPYPVQRIFCFPREQTRIREIIGGLPVTDRYVLNFRQIYEALTACKFSPIDHLMVFFRGLQGMVQPATNQDMSAWPELSREEFEERNHFSEAVRGQLQLVVEEAYREMQADRLARQDTFSVYIRRQGLQYHVNIMWKKKFAGN